LLTRWLEVAAFHPIDRDHTSSGTAPQEPWENGTRADLNLRRRFIEERYRLMPYIYTTVEEMSRTGLPIMRPLFLEFPFGAADGEPFDLSDSNTFLLGPDLLVAQSPYPDELDDYTMGLPPIGWYDYWTGAQVDGNAGNNTINNPQVARPEVHLHSSLDTIPVFVRAGAIVPEQPLVQSTDEKPQGPLTLRVYPPTQPGRDCSGSLYLDDGISYAFRRGEFLRMKFTCRPTAHGLMVTLAPRQGSFAPWWQLVSIEVYGQTRSAAGASTSRPGSAGIGTNPVFTGFDPEHHRITALVPDDGKGLELELAY
jgi:alpha-glucosidase